MGRASFAVAAFLLAWLALMSAPAADAQTESRKVPFPTAAAPGVGPTGAGNTGDTRLKTSPAAVSTTAAGVLPRGTSPFTESGGQLFLLASLLALLCGAAYEWLRGLERHSAATSAAVAAKISQTAMLGTLADRESLQSLLKAASRHMGTLARPALDDVLDDAVAILVEQLRTAVAPSPAAALQSIGLAVDAPSLERAIAAVHSRKRESLEHSGLTRSSLFLVSSIVLATVGLLVSAGGLFSMTSAFNTAIVDEALVAVLVPATAGLVTAVGSRRRGIRRGTTMESRNARSIE